MEMTLPESNDATLRELSLEELEMISGGKWSWGEFAKAVGIGAAAGGMGGAAVGGIGAAPGAIGGGLLGGFGYAAKEVLDQIF
jgi:hypothetical protein